MALITIIGWDMFNHASNPNVNWENEFQFDDRNQHHINATALQDIKSGDELFIYYGQGFDCFSQDVIYFNT